MTARSLGRVLRPMWLRCCGASVLMAGWLLCSSLAQPLATSLLTPFLAGATWLLLLGGFASVPGSVLPRGLSPGPRLMGRCLPCWRMRAWRQPRHWTRQLALLAMLPMMAALPLQGLLCRAGGLPLPGMMLLHWFAMFGPALLLAALDLDRHPKVAGGCAPLFLVGLTGSCVFPGVRGELALTLALGMAWSLSWVGVPGARPESTVPSGNPSDDLRGRVLDAALLVLLGGLVLAVGPDLLTGLLRLIALMGIGSAGLAWVVDAAGPAASPSISSGAG